MEPAVRVELTTNGLQIRCSATELRWLFLLSLYFQCVLHGVIVIEIPTRNPELLLNENKASRKSKRAGPKACRRMPISLSKFKHLLRDS